MKNILRKKGQCLMPRNIIPLKHFANELKTWNDYLDYVKTQEKKQKMLENSDETPKYIQLFHSDFYIKLETEKFLDITEHVESFLNFHLENVCLSTVLQFLEFFSDDNRYYANFFKATKNESREFFKRISDDDVINQKYTEMMSESLPHHHKFGGELLERNFEFSSLSFISQMKLLLVLSKYHVFRPRDIKFFIDHLISEIKEPAFFDRFKTPIDVSVFIVFANSFMFAFLRPEVLELLDLPNVLNRTYNLVLEKDLEFKKQLMLQLTRLKHMHTCFLINRLIKTIFLDL